MATSHSPSVSPSLDAGRPDGGDVLVARYELREVLGSGSSAVVRRAWDRERNVWVAVKIFHTGVEMDDPRRRRSEIDAMTRVRHPGLVTLYDSGGGADGPAFVVLDLVEGPTLSERVLLGGPLHPEHVRRLGARIADALAHVHAAGIVHRDVKPANILLEADGSPRLTDFGVAQALDGASVTRTGAIVGTAAFLAPEQVRGHRVAPAADVYALGLVLLEAATGRREYPGTAVESATARLHRSPAVPRDLPADLVRMIKTMTATEPTRRPTAAAVSAALVKEPGTATLPAWQRPTGRPLMLATALVVAGGIAAASVFVDVVGTGSASPGSPTAAVPAITVPSEQVPSEQVPMQVPAVPVPVAPVPVAPVPVAPVEPAPRVLGGGPVAPRVAQPDVPAPAERPEAVAPSRPTTAGGGGPVGRPGPGERVGPRHGPGADGPSAGRHGPGGGGPRGPGPR